MFAAREIENKMRRKSSHVSFPRRQKSTLIYFSWKCKRPNSSQRHSSSWGFSNKGWSKFIVDSELQSFAVIKILQIAASLFPIIEISGNRFAASYITEICKTLQCEESLFQFPISCDANWSESEKRSLAVKAMSNSISITVLNWFALSWCSWAMWVLNLIGIDCECL